MKKCKKCGIEKDLSDFYPSQHKNGGRNYWCKKCQKIRQKTYSQSESFKIQRLKTREKRKIDRRKCLLKQQYNLSLKDYERMLISQNGKCAICGNGETYMRNGKAVSLAVDHNHITGKVRGLLCQKCNHALGLLKENPLIIYNMNNYLSKHEN